MVYQMDSKKYEMAKHIFNGSNPAKNEKVDSLHVFAIKFIRRKQMVYLFSTIPLTITVFVNMWDLGQFREILIFC